MGRGAVGDGGAADAEDVGEWGDGGETWMLHGGDGGDDGSAIWCGLTGRLFGRSRRSYKTVAGDTNGTGLYLLKVQYVQYSTVQYEIRALYLDGIQAQYSICKRLPYRLSFYCNSQHYRQQL